MKPENQTPNTTTIELTPEQMAIFKKAGQPILRALMIPLLLFSLLPTILGGYFTIAGITAPLARTETIDATISHVDTSLSHDDDTDFDSRTCTFSYRFTINSRTFTGSNSVGTTNNCALQKGDIVTASYNPSDPSDNGMNEPFLWIFGLIFFVPGATMMLTAFAGLALLRNKDNAPATRAQLELIENGFRELGEFWTPHQVTQGEARSIMADINRRIELQKRR